jgi:hypothetical protein
LVAEKTEERKKGTRKFQILLAEKIFERGKNGNRNAFFRSITIYFGVQEYKTVCSD